MKFKRLLLTISLLFLLFSSHAQTYVMSNSTVNVTGGNFYDSGGNAVNYTNGENITMTFCSGVAGSCVQLIFSSFATEPDRDSLTIYNGPSTASPLIGSYSGLAGPGIITASSGCLTVVFRSDGSVRGTGWAAVIKTVPCTPSACTATCAGSPPANDDCSTAQNLGALPAPADCPSGEANSIVVNGSTLCATASSPYYYQLFCQGAGGNTSSNAADVWYEFDVTGQALEITISGMQSPSIAIYSGTCGNLAAAGCATGSGGQLNFSSSFTTGHYFLQVSGANASDRCDFTMTLRNYTDCRICLIDANLVASPPPINGTYSPGQTVSFCYNIDAFRQIATNWLHGVVPTFGAGWDLSTLTTSAPPNCAGSGAWAWYNNVISGNTGVGHGPGFFFETGEGNPSGNMDANPGNNFGDNPLVGCGWSFCWTIKTKPLAACVNGANLTVKVKTFGDSETGSYTIEGCEEDPADSSVAVAACCAPPLVTVTNSKCNTSNNGSAIATGQGTGPWVYQWKNAAGTLLQTSASINTSNTITGLAAGNYSVITTDNNGCTATSNFTITAPPALLAIITTLTNVTCNGGNNGGSSATATGGTSPYTFLWSTGAATTSVSNLIAGTYSVTATDANGCTYVASVIITQPLIVTASITANTAASCNGGANGSLTATPGGGTAPYTYLWSNGAVTATASGLAAGTYTVTISDSRGCYMSASAAIAEPTVITLNTSSTPASCGNPSGTATVIAGGGTPSYTYTWAPSGGNAATANALSAGGYTITVTDSKGCTGTANVNVANSSGPAASISASADATCNGATNGSATVSVAGGATPYDYLWSNGDITATTNNLAAGNYTVTVTDDNGCTSTATVIINQPAVLNSSILTNIPASCNSNSNGSLTASASGGTAPYSYIWSNGTAVANNPGLAAGTYTVTVTDNRGCTSLTNAAVAEPPVLSILLSSSTDVSCYNGTNGQLTASASGGTSPYSYLWSNGTATANNAGLAAGSYTVTATDANNCTATAVFSINQPALFSVTINSVTDALCFGATNGSALTNVAGGTTPYTYLWSSGAITAGLNNVAAASYTVTVTDANNCTVSAATTINEPSELIVSPDTKTDVLCNAGNNGSITITASGATAPYTYAWSTASGSGTSATGLSAGNYTVTVTDANGCTKELTTTIAEPLQLTASITANTAVSCNGGNNGSLTAAPLAGTAPYSYSWSGGGSSNTESSLVTGTYTVTVTDANGCTTQTSSTVTEPAAIDLVLSATSANCGTATGTANVVAGGGTPAYTYLWSPSGDIISNPTGLSSGAFAVTVTDANGCTASGNIQVPNATGPTASINTTVDTKCNGSSDGSAEISVSGGNLPYTYQWSPNVSSSAIAAGLAAGNYTVTVTDANNCTSIAAVNINEPDPVVPSITVLSDALCNGAANGSLEANAIGGNPAYTYFWSNADITAITNNLAAATYTVTATDANGCTGVTQGIIAEPPVLQASFTNTVNVSCNAGTDGSLQVTANGGVLPYTYLWSNGDATATSNNLSAGTYTVTATDANGCTTEISSAITEPTAITLSLSATSANCGTANGTATVIANGGIPPYTYLWANGDVTATSNNLTAATYTVTVTDVNGCTATNNVQVPNATGPTASITTTVDAACKGSSDGNAEISVSGGTLPYAYLWSPNVSSSATASGLAAGNYTVTVSDANNCSSVLALVINEPTAIVPNINVLSDALCNGSATGSLEATAGGGTPAYTYLWSNADVTAISNNLAAATYTVTATDSKGCTGSAQAIVAEPSALQASFINIVNVTCNAGNDGSLEVTTTGGVSPYTYLWSNGDATTTSNNIIAGTYTVTVTDANGCSIIEQQSLSEPSAIVLNMSSTDATCGASNGSVSVVANGGTGSYSYLWTPGGDITANVNALPSNSYSVIVTDANSCTVTDQVQINNVGGPQITVLSSTDVSCFGGTDGAITTDITAGVSPYSYQWSDATLSGANANNLAAGTYTVTVTDANSCNAAISITINEPSQLSAVTNAATSHCGQADGSASVSPAGGTPVYTYAWSANASTADNIINVLSGTYTVTITDSKGCTAEEQIIVPDISGPQIQILSTDDVSCFGGSNGTASIAVNSPSVPDYLWSNGNITSSINGVIAGVYTVTVTDASGCTDQESITINEPAAIALNMLSTTATCGSTNGSAEVNIIGGTIPFSFAWSTGTSTTSVNSNLAAGSYTVTVTDAKGCTAEGNTVVANAGGPVLAQGVIKNVSCNAGNDGAATVTIISGTAPFQIIWNTTGGNALTETGLFAGNNSVEVKDANGCSSTLNFFITEPTPLVVSNVTTDVSCFAGVDGTASVDAFGGTAPYTFDWTPGGLLTASRIALPAGNYSVKITDVVGCTATTLAKVSEPAQLTNAPVISDAGCFGSADGSINLNTIGGISPYTFNWSSGAIGSVINNLTAGSYTVTVSDNNGCSFSSTHQVNEPSEIIIQSQTAAATCGTANGSASVITSGGTGTINYLWDGGQIISSISNVTSGTYTVTVTDQSGCSKSEIVAIANQGGPIASLTSSSDVTCNGGNNGNAAVTVSSGNAPFDFNWLPSGGTAQSANNLAAGNYSVEVKDANGCITAIPVVITEPSAINVLVNTSDATCGNPTGTANANVTGGTGNYDYLWSNGSTGVSSLSNLASNSYSVTVTDANGCSVNQNFVVAAIGGATVNIQSVSNVTCNGGANGSASVSIISGNGPFTYQWLPSGGSADNASGLAAGNYTVNVSDANGCATPTNISITEPDAITIADNIQSATCGTANGSASVIINGGLSPYQYLWSDGSAVGQIQNVTAGNYTVTITDANSCTSQITIIIPNANGPAIAIDSQTDVSCNGGNNGTATISVNGGSGTLNYLWSDGSVNAAANNLSAGTYTVTVTDGNGCTSISQVQVNEPAVLQNANTSTDASCGRANGSITTLASGGKSNYSYLWNNGATTNDINTVSAGNYTVTITDQKGCSLVSQAVIGNINGPAVAIDYIHNVSCNGDHSGEASIDVVNGTAPFAFAWLPSGGNSALATGIAADNYSVTTTDANGCSITTLITVTEPSAVQLQIQTSPASCNVQNGSITVVSTGGTGTHAYNWSNGANTASINSLSSAVYTLTVTDQSGCSVDSTISLAALPGPIVSAASINDVKCFNGSNGSASVNVNSGTAPYIYQWQPSGGNNSSASNLTAGNYSVIVTDVNGCSQTLPIQIAQPTLLVASQGAMQNVSCYNGNNGSAQVNAAGGTSPYGYQWSNAATTAINNNLVANNYSVTVTDANGCTSQQNFIITQPTELTASAIATNNVSCYGGNNGRASVSPAGGTTPYDYSWSNGSAGNDTTFNLAAGNYAVTVSDNNGCTLQSNFGINQPALLITPYPSTQNVSCYGLSNGSAVLNPNGGVLPYTISWSAGGTGTNASNLSAGNYDALVTDANGCTSARNFDITQPDQLTLSAQITPVNCFGENSGALNVIPQGGTSAYAIVWNSSLASGYNIPNLPAGVYTATLTDAHSCKLDSTWIISQPSQLTLQVNAPSIICIGQNANLNTTVNGGVSSYVYNWSNGFNGASQQVNPAITSVYTVSVTDNNGCTVAPQSITVPVYPLLTAAITVSSDSICKGETVSLTGLGSGGNGGPYTYTWSNQSGNVLQQNVSPVLSTSYTLNVSDNCGTPIANAIQNVIVNPNPIVDFNPNEIADCSPVSVSFSSTSQTTPNSIYQWTFGDQATGAGTNTSHIYTEAGTYDVSLTVTNIYGCTSTLTRNDAVTVYPLPNAFFVSNPQETSILNPVITFGNQSTTASSFTWNFGDGTDVSNDYAPTHSYQDTGHYTVMLIAVSSNGCVDTFYSEVIITKDLSVYIPNAFTPNGDGQNDFFTAYGIGIVKGDLFVYDRWGKNIFYGPLTEPWDGTRKDTGQECAIGVYVYLFKIQAMDGTTYEYTGKVTLVR